jgi:Leucine-rich repeat (LRR) protein
MQISVVAEVKRLIADTRARKDQLTALEVTELAIGSFTPPLAALLEGLSQLRFLSLTACALRSLASLPKLPLLEQMDLTSNQLDDLELQHLGKYRRLKVVNLPDNQIASLHALDHLLPLSSLEQLELYENPIA